MNPIKLFENKTISVIVKHPEGDSYPEIILKHGSPPQIQLRADIIEKDITVNSINDNYFDTYFISDIHKQNLFSPAIFKYLFIGNANKDKLKKVCFTIPELSSYFHTELKYELDNDANISGSLKIQTLEAKVEKLGLSIKIHQGYDLKPHEDNTGFSFKNIIYFSYESDTYLSFQQIEKLMYKTIGLLTWITGYPVTIESIDVSDKEKSGYLYLPSFKKLKKYDTKFPKSFMHLNILRESFNDICNNYFDKKEIFEDIWSRTIPLFDFTGVLEYEVMLYASILDKYFSYQVDKLKLNKNKNYGSYITKVDGFLKKNDEFKKILEGTDLIDKIKVRNLFPSKTFVFIERKEAYFQAIGEENLKIFMSNEDFINIKKIRDRAAHGDVERLEIADVLKYSWKVKALTMYLIYMDLGIKEDDFFKILSNTLHPIRMNCELDDYLFELKTDKIVLIQSSLNEKIKIQKLDLKVKVFNKKNDQYIFNLALSQQAHDYFSDNIIKVVDSKIFYSYEKYIKHLIDQKNINLKTKFYNKAYLINQPTNILIFNVIVIY